MRRRIYEIIEVSEDGDSLSKAYDIFMMMCIIASLVPLAFKEQNGVFNVMDWITTIIFVCDVHISFVGRVSGSKDSLLFFCFRRRILSYFNAQNI